MALATQCPHCYTSFRVANDQLKLYAGLVRCGSCQQTFNGIDHLLSPGQSPKVRPETPSKIVTELNPTSDIHVEHVEDLASSTTSLEITTDISKMAEEINHEIQEIQQVIQPESTVDTFSPSDEVTSSENELIENSHEELIVTHSPEKIAEAEIDDIIQYEAEDHVNDEPQINDIAFADELGASNEPVISMESLTEFKNTLDQIGENLTILEEKTYSPQHNIVDVEVDDISESAIDELTNLEVKNTHDFENSEAHPIEDADYEHSESIEDELTSNSIVRNDIAETETESESESEAKTESEFESETKPVSKSISYDALMHNEVDVDIENEEEIDDTFDEVKPKFVIDAEKKQRYGKWITSLYSFLIILLIVSAMGQLTYYFRDQVFAHVPQSRVHLIKACKLLNCSIHLLADKGAVTKESQELVLLSSNPQIFTLSVLLQNRSSTAQAWPMIELTLTDNRKKTLLQKVFTPKEYLDNPKDLNRGIAANVEKNIDINFELDIPKAASFEVKLFYP